MRAETVLISLVVITSGVAAAEAVIVVTGSAVAAAALAALKGAALLKIAGGLAHKGLYHHHHHHHKRSVESEIQQGENLLLSSVQHLDPSGCILKLLCQLVMKDKLSRTLEENILLELFSNTTETLTVYNAAFIGAAVIGERMRDIVVCEMNYSRCPLDDTQLRSLLQKAWGCGFDMIGEEMNAAR